MEERKKDSEHNQRRLLCGCCGDCTRRSKLTLQTALYLSVELNAEALK